MLCTVFPWICGLLLGLVLGFTPFKMLIIKRYADNELTFGSVGYIWKVYLTTVINVVTSLRSILDVALHRRMFGTCCLNESKDC